MVTPGAGPPPSPSDATAYAGITPKLLKKYLSVTSTQFSTAVWAKINSLTYSASLLSLFWSSWKSDAFLAGVDPIL